MLQAMLTTTDNPYNPFDDYDRWHSFDSRKGYHTPEYLARLVVTSDQLSDEDQLLDIENAIDLIVNENINGLYKKVTKEISIDEELYKGGGGGQ